MSPSLKEGDIIFFFNEDEMIGVLTAILDYIEYQKSTSHNNGQQYISIYYVPGNSLHTLHILTSTGFIAII